MFDSNHYIPVLRWKAAEKEALHLISPESRKDVTPLIELMMPRPELYKGATKKERDEKKVEKTPNELWEESIILFNKALPKLPEDISKCWGDTPIFVDVRFVDASIRAKALDELMILGKEHNLFLVPVVNMIPVIDLESDKQARDVAVKYAKEGDRGLCLRLLRSNLRKETIADELSYFLKVSGLTEAQVDLIADIGVADTEYATFTDSLQSIPNLAAWRTFSVISGAFPPDLSEFKVPDAYRIDRTDWCNWINPLSFEKLSRKPAFGDYTIQSPIYKEPPRISFPSASIRYTADDQWVIMRGQGGPGRKANQYLANARLLTDLPEFDGAAFSYGDSYIAEKAVDLASKKTGSPTTWLVTGVNRHLMKVASQIAILRDK